MSLRFQADADFDRRIVRALIRYEPNLDCQLATEARRGLGLQGLHDTHVLAVAASDGRILLSHDYRTMPRHFGDFIATETSPGVILIPQRMRIAVAVEWLVTLWATSRDDEWVNQIMMLSP